MINKNNFKNFYKNLDFQNTKTLIVKISPEIEAFLKADPFEPSPTNQA